MSYGNGDIEQELLRHYNIPHLYPQEWPSSKDTEGDGEAEKPSAADAKAKHLRRYTQLEKGPRTTMMFRGSKAPSGQGPDMPAPPKDEPDALGASASTLAMLRQKRAPIDVDPEYRNKFFLSSPQFSPNTYLHQLHNTASTTELVRGLDYLSNSMEAKSATLKELVESNFERFVRAKAIVDSVYTEMRNHGDTGQRMSRQGLGHNRKVSNNAAEKRKNALVEESDYGTIGMRRPLVEATTKAQEIWGPALGGREREDHLKLVLASIEANRVLFDTGTSLEDCIKRRDYEALADEYAKAERYGKEAQSLAARLSTDSRVTDQQIHQILITGRILLDVRARIEDFKRDTWRRLTTVNVSTTPEVADGKQEEYMELISILLQLGVDQNPITAWLTGRHEYLRNRVKESFERIRRDLEVMRRRLAASPKPNAKVLAMHLRTASNLTEPANTGTDTHQVLRFWDKEASSLSSLLSSKGGLYSEVSEFWETAQGFMEGSRQRHLPAGIEGRSRAYHRLDNDFVRKIQADVRGLFELMRQELHALFVGAPLQEIEGLFSPTSPVAKTPHPGLMSPSKAARFTFNPSDLPPPIEPSSEPWEKYAFWPPHGNSLSAVTSLAKITVIVASAATEMVKVPLVRENAELVHKFQTLVSDIRERSIAAICAQWALDSENCRELEDWTRSSDKVDITNMPIRFNDYEKAMLNNLQKIVYLSAVPSVDGSLSLVQQGSNRNIDAVAKGFKNSLYKAFAGMMEHAAQPNTGILSADRSEALELTVPVVQDQVANSLGDTIDATSNSVRKLLTISNFQYLRGDVVQVLTETFKTCFALSLGEDKKTARDVLSQMHARVFQSYTRPTCDNLRQLVLAGITSPTYASTDPNFRPTDAKPFAYDVLLAIVLVHTEVSRTTPQLTASVMSYLLEQLSAALIDSLRRRTRYSLTALMQATLDVEFLAQTLDNYTTKRASEIQGEIYQALDERTDNDARQRLQNGLPEMKAILRKLRERTKGEFGCFKKPKKNKREGASTGGEKDLREPGVAY